MKESNTKSKSQNIKQLIWGTVIAILLFGSMVYLQNKFFGPNTPQEVNKKIDPIKKPAPSLSAKPSKPDKDMNSTTIKKVIEKQQYEASYRNTEYYSFIFDTRTHDIDFMLKDNKGSSISTLDNAVKYAASKDEDIVFATNAGMFHEDRTPVGLFISDSKIIQPINTEDGNGNFFLKPNGIFFMEKNGKLGVKETTKFEKSAIHPKYATQSGPLLLENGKIHPAFNEGSTNLRVRSGVGIISQYQAVFLLSKTEVNYFDFSMTFKEKFKCKDALFLDGVISEVFIQDVHQKKSTFDFSGIIAISED